MKKHISTKIIFSLTLCISSLSAPAQNQIQQKPEFPSKEKYKNTKITSKIIPCLNSTWGYDIYLDNKLMIHQSSVPALPGNEGFKTKEAAQKAAELVISKIKKGKMPPSVTMEEMKELRIL